MALLISSLFSGNIFADTWDICDSCDFDASKNIAIYHAIQGRTERVHILDRVNESLNSFDVISFRSEGGGFYFYRTIALEIVPSAEVQSAATRTFDLLAELKSIPSPSSSDLDTIYDSAAYLINNGNADSVAISLGNSINNYITGIPGFNVRNAADAAAQAAAVQNIVIQVSFPDGSKAIFELKSISIVLDGKGKEIDKIYNFKRIKLLDKNGKPLPLSAQELIGRNEYVDADTVDTWNIVMEVLSIQSQLNLGSSLSGTMSCVASAGIVTCTFTRASNGG